jgi:hypothetical protein
VSICSDSYFSGSIVGLDSMVGKISFVGTGSTAILVGSWGAGGIVGADDGVPVGSGNNVAGISSVDIGGTAVSVGGCIVFVGCGSSVLVGCSVGASVGIIVLVPGKVAVGVMVAVAVGVTGIIHESVEWQLLHLPRECPEGRSSLWQELQFV